MRKSETTTALSNPGSLRPPLRELDKLPNNPELTQANERESHFLQMGRDVHGLILEKTDNMQNCIALASSCFTIWSKSQAAIFRKLLREAYNSPSIDGITYLIEMLESYPILKKHGINYRHLATILSRARSLLMTIVQVDPYCAWKIAAISGLKEAVKELLGPEITTKTDSFGRNVLAYYALGGQLECIVQFLEEHPELFPLSIKTLATMARMAAIGGHIPVLKYLRDQHGFALNYIFEAPTENDDAETLLTAAVSGGDTATVTFLREEEQAIDHSIDQNLALIAADHGHWDLYDQLAEEMDPTLDQNDALFIAQSAARYGKFDRVISMMQLHNILPEELVLEILNGGNPELFWYGLDNNWFSLEDTFDNGATVQHILARQGHLELLKTVLKDQRALKATHPNAAQKKKNKKNAIFVVDDNNQTILHYACSGGQTNVCDYVLNFFDELPVDNYGSSLAHVSSAAGSVWLLRKLLLSKNGNALILLKDNQGGSILHDAANCGQPNIMVMLIDEFHLNPTMKDAYGRTPLHILANRAKEELWIWDSISFLHKRYITENLIDIPDNSGMTVRQIFEEWKADQGVTADLFNPESDLLNISATVQNDALAL